MQLDEARGRLTGEMSKRKTPTAAVPNGLVLVDKPSGPSSFALVRETAQNFSAPGSNRRIKAGHAGTLDPAATGLLLVLLGRSTRLAQYIVGLDKRYRTEIRLGLTTSTGDAEGDPVTETPPRSTVGLAEELVGELELPVPAASAVKIDGERAYARHRRGERVEMPVRRSTVHSAELLDATADRITLDLHVSSGTYVRAIAEHLGGHCLSIRRLSVGPFDVRDADAEAVVSPLEALAFLPRAEVDAEQAAALRHGRQITCDGNGLARAAHAGELVAVISCLHGKARPETVLAS